MPKRQRQQWFLRVWRKHRGLSQQQLADRLETTTSRISELETGNERYNQDVLEALASALSLTDDPVTPSDLLSRKPGDPANPFQLWERIPLAERPRAGRILGRVMEDFVADFDADKPPTPAKSVRRKRRDE